MSKFVQRHVVGYISGFVAEVVVFDELDGVFKVLEASVFLVEWDLDFWVGAFPVDPVLDDVVRGEEGFLEDGGEGRSHEKGRTDQLHFLVKLRDFMDRWGFIVLVGRKNMGKDVENVTQITVCGNMVCLENKLVMFALVSNALKPFLSFDS